MKNNYCKLMNLRTIFLSFNMSPFFISSHNKSKSLEYVQTFLKHVVQIREERAVPFNRIIPARVHKSATTNCWKPSLLQG